MFAYGLNEVKTENGYSCWAAPRHMELKSSPPRWSEGAKITERNQNILINLIGGFIREQSVLFDRTQHGHGLMKFNYFSWNASARKQTAIVFHHHLQYSRILIYLAWPLILNSNYIHGWTVLFCFVSTSSSSFYSNCVLCSCTSLSLAYKFDFKVKPQVKIVIFKLAYNKSKEANENKIE